MEEKIILREAIPTDMSAIWAILSAAIARRKADGSDQWQDGYPNEAVVAKDIAQHYGYVLTENDEIIGYCALILNNEPAYNTIDGNWLTNGDFLVIHRVAIAPKHLGRGLSVLLLQRIENIARQQGVASLRADTNYDNAAMLHLFGKMGYQYCGEVVLRGAVRKAFEKKL
jgi:acetyltransferase, GNAT family